MGNEVEKSTAGLERSAAEVEDGSAVALA